MKLSFRKIPPHIILKMISYWPPYLGAGIKVREVKQDLSFIKVEMKQSFYNTNYVGVHFGGSLYSMCDPFFMFMLIHKLGNEFIVWDQAAEIKFIKPGIGKVHAIFEITSDQLEEIKQKLRTETKIRPMFTAQIINSKNEIVAQIKKTLYIRKK